MKTKLLIVLACLGIRLSASAQGFVNLGFESCTLSTNLHAIVSVGVAFPSWSVYRGGVLQTEVAYNAVISQQSHISLNSTTMSFPMLSGDYNARFLVSTADGLDVALGQVGQIPIGASSLQFMTASVNPVPAGGLTVTFGGSPLSLIPLGLAPGYTLWTADISAFAGNTGELRFTANQVGGNWATYLDDIMFVPVPEPSTWALLALGGAAFACAAHRRGGRVDPKVSRAECIRGRRVQRPAKSNRKPRGTGRDGRRSA
jgi:hypothetical protein